MKLPLIDISNFSKNTHKTIVIFIDEDFHYASEYMNFFEKSFLERIKNYYNFKGKFGEIIQTLSEEKHEFQKLICIGLGTLKDFTREEWLKLGGVVWNALETTEEASLLFSFPDLSIHRQIIEDFILGIYLRSYKFDKYFSKRSSQEKELNLTLCCPFHKEAEEILSMACAVSETVSLARDLVNEPGNILTPEQFCARIQSCSAYGLEIEILEKEKLLSLGMHALLGVAQGSTKSPYLAIMRWQGTKIEEPPIAFVGKGITFDSGGISIKPSMHMEEMKGDMGGAAAVVGSLCLLAKRKAPVNAVGVIALAENMPDGNAQRPGDIVTSMSGVTIEINNTDAEGRLALADALFYTKKTFKPKCIVDLATLTGAITVALGTQYAGLFSNNSDLAKQLIKAGESTGEKLWQLPLAKEYDKMLESQFADIKNSCGRQAGAITAAQFLQRFVEEEKWAHIDIAGTASDALKSPYCSSWSTGFGVRLLDRFVAENYEK